MHGTIGSYMYLIPDRRHGNTTLASNKPQHYKNMFNFNIFLGGTSGFGNALVRQTSRFFDEIRALLNIGFCSGRAT